MTDAAMTYAALAGWVSEEDGRRVLRPALRGPEWATGLLAWSGRSGSPEVWPQVVARIVGLAPHLVRLEGDQGDRLRSRCLAHIVREARSHVLGSDAASLRSVDNVLALLDRHGGGGAVSAEEWWGASRAAKDAARVDAATDASWAASWAASREGGSASSAARVAADAAVDATKDVSWAAAAMMRVAAADRITHAVLTELERALVEEDGVR